MPATLKGEQFNSRSSRDKYQNVMHDMSHVDRTTCLMACSSRRIVASAPFGQIELYIEPPLQLNK